MSRTYTVNSTSMNAGRRSSYSTNWTSFQAGEAAGLVTGYGSAGYSSSYYRLVNMRFDTSAYSSKTITGIKLRITVSSGTLGSTSYPYRVRYKYNDTATNASSSDCWTSTNEAQSAKGSYDLATWDNGKSSGTTTITANSTHDFSVGTTLPKYGYVIGGQTGNAYMTLDSTAQLLITTNETLTLAYNANGGSGAPSNSSKNGTPNATFTISSTIPTRAGYKFLGWSTSSTATSASYSAGGSITLSTTGTTTLYAVWQAYKVTIRYHVNGGTLTTGTGTTRYRVSSNLVQVSSDSGSTWSNLTATIATGTAYVNLHNVCGSSYDGGVKKTGHHIVGASAFRAGSTSGTLINQDTASASDTNAATIANLTGSSTLTADVTVTLYINWVADTYTVSYNKGSYGTGTNTTDTKTYGVSLTLKGAIFTRTGYTQTGWSTTDGGAKAYNLSASYTANAAVTLYPFWTADTYTVSYDKGANGTGTNTTDTKTYGVALTLLGAIFTRAGYTQTGWSTTDGGAKAYNLSASYTANAAVTLYPFWEASSIIHVRDGNTIKSGTIWVRDGNTMKMGIAYVRNGNTMVPTI